MKAAVFFFAILIAMFLPRTTTPSPLLNLTLVNNCPFTVFPAIQPNSGYQALENVVSILPTLSHFSFQAPSTKWSGRIWARTGCTHTSASTIHCITGDCNNQVACDKHSGAAPATLVQLSLHHGQEDLSSYAVSLVDGFNVPLTVTPHEGKGRCPVVGCTADFLSRCPPKMQTRYPPGNGEVVGCRSGCDVFGTDELCCKGYYNSPKTCKASVYSKFFKDACPATFTYAHDSPSLMHYCSSPRELKVIFCH